MLLRIGLIVLLSLCGGLNAAPDYNDNTLRFVSHEPLNKHDTNHYRDCHEVRHSGGYSESGLYNLHLNKSYSYQVQCEHTPNTSFTVIQRRINGRVNFKQGWEAYENGFGKPKGDYWVGLNQIYHLTNMGGNNVLKIDMQTWKGRSVSLRYNFFRLRDRSTKYTLDISRFQGAVRDDLAYNNGMPFATHDNPDRHSCAPFMQAGWWYNHCTYALPNGQY